VGVRRASEVDQTTRPHHHGGESGHRVSEENPNTTSHAIFLLHPPPYTLYPVLYVEGPAQGR
jgi:hypothetical protein